LDINEINKAVGNSHDGRQLWKQWKQEKASRNILHRVLVGFLTRPCYQNKTSLDKTKCQNYYIKKKKSAFGKVVRWLGISHFLPSSSIN